MEATQNPSIPLVQLKYRSLPLWLLRAELDELDG
jgi:hypothetical protein